MKQLLHLNLLLSLLFWANTAQADIILEELFIGSTLPTGWTTTPIQGAQAWTIRNSPAFGSASGSYYAVFDDEALGAATIPNESALTSPIIDCSNHYGIKLRFSHHWFGVENTHGYVEVSNNGGALWTTLIDYEKITKGSIPTPQDTTFDISALADNQATLQFRFRFNDGSVAGKFWYIDDIVLFSDPDVGIEQLVLPGYLNCGTSYTNTEAVMVAIHNYSDDSVSNIPVQIDVTGALTQTLNATYTGTIPPRDSVHFLLPVTIDMSANGVYHFLCFTQLLADGYLLNDTLLDGRTQHVTVYPYLEQYNYSNAGWTTGSNSATKYWDHNPIPYLNGAQGNGKSWYLTSDNDGSRDAWVMSPTFDLSALTNPILNLDIKMMSLNDANDRYVVMQYSINNGVTWTQLAPNGQANFYGVSPQTSCCGWGNGTIDQWTSVYYGLCALIGQPCVKFRFFANDLYETQFAFDNFEIFDRIDAGVSAFVGPVQTSCLYTDQEYVTIRVNNYSCLPIDSIPVTCIISNALTDTLTGMVVGPIPSNGFIDYTFATPIDLTPLGLYDMMAFTDASNDFNNLNDTAFQTIVINDIKIYNYPYSQNFDVDTAYWEGGPTNTTNLNKYWDWGAVPYLGGPAGNGNSFFLTDVNAGSVDAWVYTPIFDFSEVTEPDLEFDILMNSLNDANDRYVVVQYRLNETGAWTNIGANTDPLWYGISPQTTCCGWGNGTLTPWVHVFLEDMCVVSGESCVRFRFFANDSYETQFAFDNILLSREGDDLTIRAITPPNGGPCGAYTATEQVGILLRNNTCRPLTNIPVRIDITGPNTYTFLDTVPGPILGLDELQFIFPSTIDMSLPGTYTFTAEVFDNPLGTGWSYINDTLPSNNIHSEVRYSNTPIDTFPYLADFNTTNNGWASLASAATIDDKYFYWDTIPYLNGPEGEGKSWNLNFENLGSRDCWVESPVFDFTLVSNPILSMDIKLYSLNDAYDRYNVVQYSLNGGATWTQLGANGYPDWYGVSPQTTCCGWGNGTLNQWTNVYYAMCNLAGQPCVKFRIFGNDLYETQFAFDNFEIIDRVDVGVTAFVDPLVNACLYTDQEIVTVTITNFSCVPVDSVPVECIITGPSPDTLNGMYTGVIAPGASVNYTFTGTINMLPMGNYVFTGYTQYPGDANLLNDTTILALNVGGVKIDTFPYFCNFDVDTAFWVGGPQNSTNVTKYWDWGAVPYLGGPQGNGNSFFITDVNAGSVDAWVYSPLFDFSAITNPNMEFDFMMNSLNDANDRYVVVQYRLNETGAWTNLGVNTDPLWYGLSPQTSCCGFGNGTITPWLHAHLRDICVLSGQPCVRFRFFGNDLYETQYAFDNFEIYGEPDDISVVAITPPTGGPCGTYSANEAVGVLVRNNTCRPITNIPVMITMTGPTGASFTDTIPGPILGEQALQFTFPNTVDMSLPGTYTFTATVFDNPLGIGSDYSFDTLVSNNTHSEVRYSGQPINTYPYMADFNTTNDGWASLGPATIGQKYFYWDTLSYLNGAEGEGKSWQLNYQNFGSRDAWVESPVFDLTGITNPVLGMDIKLFSLNDASDRYNVVQYSINGGATWTQLGVNGFPDWYGVSPQTSCCGFGNGTVDAWTNVYYRLCQLSAQSCIKFRIFGNDLYETQFAFDNFTIFDRPDFDVGINAMTSPAFQACTFRTLQDITVSLENFSCSNAANVPITCIVTGPNPMTVTDTIIGPLAALATMTHTFSQQINMEALGTYTFTIFVHSPIDNNQANDTLVRVINVVDTLYSTFPYTCDFNTGQAYWNGGPTNSNDINKYFNHGTVPYLGGPAGNGDCWYLTDVNAGSRDAWVYSPIFDLSGVNYPRVSMDILLNSLADASDRYVVVQYRFNETGGWTQLGANAAPNWYGEMPQISCCGWGNGTITPWRYVWFDPCATAGQSCVRFRVFGNDLYETQFAFDNFRITDTPLDAALTGNAVGCWGSTYQLDVEVYNNSSLCNATADITSIDLTYSINGGPLVTQTITGLSIPAATSAMVTIPNVTVPNTASSIQVWCSLPNGLVDQVYENDTALLFSNNWPNCNDHCTNALQLGLGTTTTTQTSNATTNPGVDPSFTGCGSPTLENTVWFQFTTDSIGGDVSVFFENTTCSPSPNGIQVSIDQLIGPPCDSSSYTNVFCESPGNTDTIQWDGFALAPNTTYYITVDGFAGNNCDFDIRITGAVGILLPTTLLNFTGTGFDNYNLLQWTTEKEINNDYFDLERSGNGISFSKIGLIDGIGNTNVTQHYQFTDNSPLEGWNYYRLKQVDDNNAYQYSNTIAIFNGQEQESLTLVPNPATDKVTFTYNGVQDGQALILTLFDASGRKLMYREYNNNTAVIQETISTKDLPSGVYFVQFTNGAISKSKKLIIKD